MLNLNYNIIGANQPFVDRGPVNYLIRTDIYSSSLVVAMPGCILRDSEGGAQFNMTNPWDDISGWVVADNKVTPPSGSSLVIQYSSSLSASRASNFVSQSTVFPANLGNYPGALTLSGENSLVAIKNWPKTQGANLDFTSSFVIESYVAWNDNLASSPFRFFVWKYDPNIPASSQYVWEGNFVPGPPDPPRSGSGRFSYTVASSSIGPVPKEVELAPTSSFNIVSGNWVHYAVVYTSGSENFGPGTDTSRQLKYYINGQLRARRTIPTSDIFNTDVEEYLQIMGAVDASAFEGAYSGSMVAFNDFRLYNGTDKNYTGSQFTPPPSMVVWELEA